MIDEESFRSALQDVEGDVIGGALMSETIAAVASDYGIPAEGLQHRAELAWGDLQAAERNLHQAGRNLEQATAIREQAKTFVSDVVSGRRPSPGKVVSPPWLRLQIWAHRTFDDEKARSLAMAAGKSRLNELGMKTRSA